MNYLFDFDGVLVGSMPVWAGTYVRLMKEYGVPMPSDFVKSITPLGNPGASRFCKDLGLPLSEEEILRRAMAIFDDEYTHRVPLKKNVAETLRRLVDRGDRVHVLTGSSHRYVDPCLARHGVFGLFENVWSVDDFPYTKAEPILYQTVADRLGVPMRDCLFFDDNPVAVRTAVSAGMPTVAVFDASSADAFDKMKETAGMAITDFAEIP